MTRIPNLAVVDVETTGLWPEGNDRIVEIAVIRMNPLGAILDEYTSLINPQRDLGPGYIHGITAKDVEHAPLFEEIAGDVLSLLAGAIFCGHNASFDARFVRSEMARLGVALPVLPILCTMRLARIADPTVRVRRLSDVCAHFAMAQGQLHCAHADCRATAELLAMCLSMVGERTELSLETLGVHDTLAGQQPWPALPVSGKKYLRSEARQARASQPHYIATLVAKLPALCSGDPNVDDYLLVLDRALEDRRITDEEAGDLEGVARELGLSQEQAGMAHLAYMRDLVRVAMADCVITPFEAADLEQVRHLLNVSPSDYALLLGEGQAGRAQGSQPTPYVSAENIEVEGKTVCFTGEFLCRIKGVHATRSEAEKLASQLGMIVRKSVTKDLDYLVTADPDSISAKAVKARRYGVRILAEPVFWQVVGSSLNRQRLPEDARKIKRPAKCPVCKGDVERDEGGVYIRCINPSCPAQLKERLIFFAGRNQMDIEGAGQVLIEMLVDRGMLRDHADLYHLHERRNELVEIKGLGQKSVDALLEGIEASKKQPLARLLAGLNIRHVGGSTAELLANHFGSMGKIEQASEDELIEVEGVGPEVARSIRHFMTSDAGRKVIERLKEAGVNMKQPKRAVAAESPLAGKTVVVTGTLESMGRKEAQDLIKQLGGKATGSVSKKTDLVVVGESPGSKFDNAKKLGVKTVDETEFLKMIGR